MQSEHLSGNRAVSRAVSEPLEQSDPAKERIAAMEVAKLRFLRSDTSRKTIAASSLLQHLVCKSHDSAIQPVALTAAFNQSQKSP